MNSYHPYQTGPAFDQDFNMFNPTYPEFEAFDSTNSDNIPHDEMTAWCTKSCSEPNCSQFVCRMEYDQVSPTHYPTLTPTPSETHSPTYSPTYSPTHSPTHRSGHHHNSQTTPAFPLLK